MKTTPTMVAMVLIFAEVYVVTSAFVHSGVAFANPCQHHQFINDVHIPHLKHLSEEKLHINEYRLFDVFTHVTNDKCPAC